MKLYNILILSIVCSANLCLGQEKLSIGSTDNMIDKYFRIYASQPGYEVQYMGEAMVKRSNETNVWKHPAISRIMKQVRAYKNLNIPVTPDLTNKIIQQLDQSIRKDKIYEEYYRYETNGKISFILYTRGNKIITEVVSISIQWGNMHVSSFMGDNIEMASIKALSGIN